MLLNERHMDRPVVSIITIVYNGEKYLQQTIDSVVNQTYKNIEYIIIDGGSKDGSLNVIKRNEKNIAKWISEKDKGIADAFNKGLHLCSGEIIGLINADDWLETGAVECVVNNIGDADILYGQTMFWTDGNPVISTKSNHLALRMGMTVSHPASFVKKRVYDKLGVFNQDYKIAMDYELFLRFFQNGATFRKVEVILSNMRRGGVSDNRWQQAILEELRVKDRYYPKLANRFYFLRQYLIFLTKKVLLRIGYHTR